MLKYSLHENLLTEREDDYSAQTHSSGSYDKEAIIAQMLQRGTLLTRTDILAVLNSFDETIANILQNGGTINLPLFNTSFSISGVFEGPMDGFDGNRHKLNINLSKGVLLRNTEPNIKFEKTSAGAVLPQIQEVKDSVSGKVNEELTPNGVVELRGFNIKISGEHPDCGLWFLPETGAPVKAVIFISNKPATVIAMIPALTAGNYQIKIVTQYSAGKDLKEPKTMIYSKTLIVK